MNDSVLNICQFSTNLLEQLCEFNRRIYPQKLIPVQNYLDFFLSKSTTEKDSFIVLKDDEDNILGQILASSMSYLYQQTRVETVWLFDLIVDERLRKSAWGIDLLLKCMELHPMSCSTGSGPTALPIHLKLGNSYLGDIRKYVGILNPFYLLISYKKRVIPIDKFPMSIHMKQCTYHKIGVDQLPMYEKPFNEDLFEICRDHDYLRWRYFSKLHNYVFYLRDDNISYFVLRSIDIKGFRVMELVDCRCKNTETEFEEIYQVAAKVTRKVGLPVLVCGSSLKTLDSVLERHHFKSIGRPRPILGFLKCKSRMEDIENRNFCFVTFADSDGETNWI